jgi:hypothetical protein
MTDATTVTLADIATRIAPSGRLGPDDIANIRRLIYTDGAVSRADAEALYAIERARRHHAPEWSTLFVEALTDHLLEHVAPAGYLDDANAAWLLAQIKARKQPAMDTDVALIGALVERAREVPATFSAFALSTVKDAVIYGDGPDATGREHGHGRVTEADVALLQRILWGAGQEGQLAISRAEAEALFAIADATAGSESTPAFDDLFARAIGNHLLAATGRAVPDRATALRHQAGAQYRADLVGALGRLLYGMSLREFNAPIRTLKEDVEAHHGEANAAREIASAEAGVVMREEADWLLERINRNGVTTRAELALVRFVAREAIAIDAALEPMIDKVA